VNTRARERNLGWLPTVVVLVVVLAAGARLIYLSGRYHAARARESAVTLVNSYALRMEPPLRQLADAARQGAGGTPVRNADSPVRSVTGGSPIHLFRMTSDHRILGVSGPAATLAHGIASEWASAESSGRVPDTTMLGPLRLGSQWLIAIRAPVPGAASGAASRPLADGVIGAPAASPETDHASDSQVWSVAYEDLANVIAGARLPGLGAQGFDFELAQTEPRSARTRVFVGSRTEPLVDAVAARIRLPSGVSPAVAASELQVAIHPRSGWFPATQLASDIGLLAFLAWLLAFGTHDLGHSLQRSRAALAVSRRRLRTVNQQLATEMQKRLSLQETFDHARFHDAFTGLPNRRYFMDQLDRALREVRTKRRHRIAVVLVDISRFKLINDTLGHTAGDELMVQAARRFERAMAAYECVLARWGGDQFALLALDAASADTAVQVALVLQEALRAPFELRRHRLVVTATLGVTSVDSGQKRAEDVVREADIALSVAKRQETVRIVAYVPNMAGQAADLVSLEADLHVALEKHELRLLFQPIVDLHSYRMVGAEALLRWCHPVESMLAPDKFLRIAEESGLMVPMTRWTLLRACRTAADWRHRLPPNEPFFISVNLSASALRDAGLVEYIASLLREYELPHWVLKCELTEAALISNVGAARETLDRLHAMGIQLMLDDFGTGYSSLSYLQLFPFDFVKIDRPFVNRTEADQANTGMMAAMVQMAGSLRLTPIAEIIETEAAARVLQEMGCEYGQGYYFSEPIEAELALQRLHSRRPFQPLDPASATQEVEPLELDDSPTLMIPADSIGLRRE